MFSVQRRIEFRDTDAAGIVHFSAFFPMMESAEHELLRHLGLSVMQPLENGSHLTWPRVSATCNYLNAAKFEDLLTIEVSIIKIGTTSLTYRSHFRCQDIPIANGEIIAVCCLWQKDGTLEKFAITEQLRKTLLPMLASENAIGLGNILP